METSLIFVALGIVSLAAGAILGYLARQTIAKKQLTTAEGKINKMLEEAEQKARGFEISAKHRAVEILEDAKRKEKDREDQIMRLEQRLEKREETLDNKMDELDRGRQILENKAEEIRRIRKEAEETRRKELARLEKIAALSKEQAKKILLQLTEEEYKKK